jgi:hypothetical protein
LPNLLLGLAPEISLISIESLINLGISRGYDSNSGKLYFG